MKVLENIKLSGNRYFQKFAPLLSSLILLLVIIFTRKDIGHQSVIEIIESSILGGTAVLLILLSFRMLSVNSQAQVGNSNDALILDNLKRNSHPLLIIAFTVIVSHVLFCSSFLGNESRIYCS
jgi:hypothetical protein